MQRLERDPVLDSDLLRPNVVLNKLARDRHDRREELVPEDDDRLE